MLFSKNIFFFSDMTFYLSLKAVNPQYRFGVTPVVSECAIAAYFTIEFKKHNHKSRWDNLPRMPTQDVSSLRSGRTGVVEAGSASMEMKTRSYDLHSKFNRCQAITAIKDLAYGYLNSFPPPDNSSTDRECNGLFSKARISLPGSSKIYKQLYSTGWTPCV